MSILLLRSQLYLYLGFTIFSEIFAYVTISLANHRDSHIPSSWMAHAGRVFVVGVCPSRT